MQCSSNVHVYAILALCLLLALRPPLARYVLFFLFLFFLLFRDPVHSCTTKYFLLPFYLRGALYQKDQTLSLIPRLSPRPRLPDSPASNKRKGGDWEQQSIFYYLSILDVPRVRNTSTASGKRKGGDWDTLLQEGTHCCNQELSLEQSHSYSSHTKAPLQ